MMMQISIASKVVVLISEMRKLRLREAGWESVWGFLKNLKSHELPAPALASVQSV